VRKPKPHIFKSMGVWCVKWPKPFIMHGMGGLLTVDMAAFPSWTAAVRAAKWWGAR
jgi:hypothetical protein